MIKQLPTIGCDPEVFLTDATTGAPRMSCGLFGGTKEKPKTIATPKYPDLGLAILEDNVTLEFNIAPSTTLKQFTDRVYYAYTEIRALANKRGLEIQIQPDMEFNAEALHANTAAMQFGCDPDLKAFARGEERIPPTPEQLGNFRCAGQHLHWGYNTEHSKTPKWALVQYLEALVVPWHQQRAGAVRKKFYGIPGLYRDKSYGFEWRSVNHDWLGNAVSGAGSAFVRDAYTILAGLLSNDKRAREVFDLIDFPQVQKMLITSTNPVKESAWIPLKNLLNEWRNEFYERGEEAIAACSPEKEELVNVRNVPGPRRAEPARPQRFADLVRHVEPDLPFDEVANG